MPAKTKAYSYVRFSTADQSHGDSMRRQSQQAIDYCDRHGLELDTSLTLADEGVSAWKGANASASGNLGVFIDLARRGVVPAGSILIIEHLDRLSRQEVRKALTLFFEILDAGITIVTLTPERTYRPGDSDPLALIEPLVYFAAANDQSEKLSSRLRQTWAEKRRRREPLTSWTPAWIRLLPDRSGYELIEEKAEIVRRIVQLALDGYGDKRLVAKLNAEKWPVITDHHCWTAPFIAKMLRSVALIGHYEPGTMDGSRRKLTGEVWEDYFPAVITEDQFLQLQTARRSRVYQRGPVGEAVANLFTGILFNARDGENFHRIMKNHPRLISAAYRNGLPEGDTQSIAYAPVEEIIVTLLSREIGVAQLYQRAEDRPPDRTAELAGKLADLEGRITTLKERIATAPDLVVLLDSIADLDLKRRQTEVELAEERDRNQYRGRELALLDDLRAVTRLYEENGVDRTALRTLLKSKIRRLVESIYVVIYGLKRSKTKTVHIQVFFRMGGSRLIRATLQGEEIVSVDYLFRGDSEDAVTEDIDLRLLNDQDAGEGVRQFVAFMEAAYLNEHKRMRKDGGR